MNRTEGLRMARVLQNSSKNYWVRLLPLHTIARLPMQLRPPCRNGYQQQQHPEIQPFVTGIEQHINEERSCKRQPKHKILPQHPPDLQGKSGNISRHET